MVQCIRHKTIKTVTKDSGVMISLLVSQMWTIKSHRDVCDKAPASKLPVSLPGLLISQRETGGIQDVNFSFIIFLYFISTDLHFRNSIILGKEWTI